MLSVQSAEGLKVRLGNKEGALIEVFVPAENLMEPKVWAWEEAKWIWRGPSDESKDFYYETQAQIKIKICELKAGEGLTGHC